MMGIDPARQHHEFGVRTTAGRSAAAGSGRGSRRPPAYQLGAGFRHEAQFATARGGEKWPGAADVAQSGRQAIVDP